jgi:adenylate cyclase
MTGRRAEGLHDFQTALDLGRKTDPVLCAIAVSNKTDLVDLAFDRADGRLVAETHDALRRAEAFGDVYGLALARWAHGTALVKSGDSHRAAGIELLELSRSGGIDIGGSVTEAELTTAMGWQDRRDDQIDTLRDTVLSEIDLGETLFAGYPVSVLVQLLVDRGAPDDFDCAQEVVAALENVIAATSLPALELWRLQCRARLAKATGDATTYTQIVARYCELAEKLDARGHIAIAKQMAAEPTFAA